MALMTLPTSTPRPGTQAVAWFAAQSFHGFPAPARPSPQPTPYVDTRPRQDYLLPSGELVTLILDHGEVPEPSRTFATGGRVVTALLAPIRRADVVALLTYAMLHNDQRLRYLAAGALGSTRSGSEPLTGSERCAAVQACADDLQMLRAMGVRIGGGL